MQYDTNYGDDDTNIDTEIIEHFRRQRSDEKKESHYKIKRNHLDERGYSLPTINRKITVSKR